jgi:hypothetical protein
MSSRRRRRRHRRLRTNAIAVVAIAGLTLSLQALAALVADPVLGGSLQPDEGSLALDGMILGLIVVAAALGVWLHRVAAGPGRREPFVVSIVGVLAAGVALTVLGAGEDGVAGALLGLLWWAGCAVIGAGGAVLLTSRRDARAAESEPEQEGA